MLRLDEIKTGDKIVIIDSGIPGLAEVVKIDPGLIYTSDGRVWNRDDGTSVFWQPHLPDGHISQNPKEWEWLEAQHGRIAEEEKRAQKKDEWLKQHRPGQKKDR